jgi:hypothetical protein
MADTPTLERLEDQISWYDGRSRYCQHMFKGLKIVTVVSAALVPVLTSVAASSLAIGLLGAIIVVVEGLQQLNQYQANWIAYRSTAETLKHEKYLHAAVAGPYSDSTNPTRLLAERLEGLISQEHAKWVSSTDGNKNK